MKSKEFDEIMKRILENSPDFPIDEATRADMAEKLAAQNQLPKPSAARYWIAVGTGIILLPLLAISWSFYQQLNLAHDKISTLEKQIEDKTAKLLAEGEKTKGT